MAIINLDGPLTVGRLREIIADLDDFIQVVLYNDDAGWYQNIDEVASPVDGDDVCVSFFPGSAFDPLQI
jgi:hypothetical protein